VLLGVTSAGVFGGVIARGKCCECSSGGRWDPKRACFFLVGKSSFVASAAFAIWAFEISFHGTRISAHLEFVFN
jgi:hypothetical protein